MVIHSYVQTPGGMGLGDFLRGSIALHQLCINERSRMIITFKDHPIGKYMISPQYDIESSVYDLNNQCDNMVELRKMLKGITKGRCVRCNITPVVCNTWPRFPIKSTSKEFVKSSLQPSGELEKAISDATPLSDYEVIHIRFGDLLAYKTTVSYTVKYDVSKLIDKICLHIEQIKNHTTRELLLMCDSDKLKKKIAKRCKIQTSSSKSVHCNVVTEKEEDGIIGTLVDFFMLTRCKHIHQFSVHGWGSTFSNAAHWIYDVPLHGYRLLEE